MQSHISALNPTEQKSNSRNALEVLIREMGMSDKEKLRLLEDLRRLNLSDDNDPIVKITLIQGLFARYTGELFNRISSERYQIENAIMKNRSVSERFSKDLNDFKDNIKVWKDDSVIELEEGIEKLRLDKKILENKITDLHQNWKSGLSQWLIFCTLINIAILLFTWFVPINNLRSKLAERKKLIKEYNITPKIYTVKNGDVYIALEEVKIRKQKDGTITAKLPKWSIAKDLW